MAAKQTNPEDIFHKAIEISDQAEQERYLDKVCKGDDKLRVEVEALLKWHTEAGSFLKMPEGDPNATLENAPIPDASGTVIGRYKLLEKIGEGGMASVYMAEQKRPIRRRVALKIIKLGMDTKQVIARFEAERQALAMMDHPNIAKVLDAGTTETGRPYFVMELVKGVSITKFCDTNHLNTEERLNLFISMCQAIQHAHQKGIIHRDIKPSNVLVTLHDGKPVVKVIDFGIAKALNQQLTEKTVFTRYSQMIGTPEYMSPEQAELSGLDIDTRTDVFSLGVLLYELLTGTTPFDSEYLLSKGYAELQRIIREEEPVRPSTKISTMGEALTDIAKHRRTRPELLCKLIRTDLDWIVMKTLEKDRSRRYQTPHALVEDIQRHLNHEPVLAGRPSKIYRLKKLLLRHRTKVVSAAALGVLIAAVVVISAMYFQSVNRGKDAESLTHKDILSKAQEFRSNGQFQEAITEVAAILDSKHVGPESHLLHARLVMELQEPAEAIEELQELLNERDEIACQAHFLLARVYLESNPDNSKTAQEYQQKAKEHQQKGEQLFSESAEAYFNRAMLTGTVNRTLECLNKAVNLDQSHYPSRKARALAYYAIGDYRNMERDAVAMTTLRDWDSLGYSLMAISLREAGDYAEAIKYHDRAIEISPDKPELYDQRCRTLIKMGNYEQALSDARECIRLNPDEGMPHFLSFCVLTALGRYDEAKTNYETIRESGLMTANHFDRLAVKYVADMLDAGLSWHPADRSPKGRAFAAMLDWAEISQPLAKKARRLVPEGFSPTWSPDGTELAYSRGVVGFAGIAIINLKSERTRLLTVPGFDPAWSPDGRYIAFNRDRKKLLVTELITERKSEVPSHDEREIWLIKADGTEEPRLLAMGYWPSWSNDSKRIFFHSSVDDMLYSISLRESARPTPIIPCTEKYPAVSPDGKYVAYPDSKSRIVELSTGSVVADCALPPVAGGGFINWSPDGRELSIGGAGLWIYDLDTKTASKVLTGEFNMGRWSPSHAKQFAIQAESIYGQHREIWVASLDPNVSTIEALGPGRTFEEHCREDVDWNTRLINTDPEDPENYFWRSLCYIPLKEYDKAAADFEEATVLLKGDNTLGSNPWLKEFMKDLATWGIDMYEAGAHEQALSLLAGIDKLRRAVGADPNSAEVAYIAMSLRQLGRGKEAETTLEQLRSMHENSQKSESLKWLCRTEKVFAGQDSAIGQVWECIELGKLNDAHQHLKELQPMAIQQNTDIRADIARATRVLAVEYNDRGRNARYNGAGYSETISDYRAALRVDPNYARVFSDLGWLLATCPETEFRDEALAIENATKACELTGWKSHRPIGVLAAFYAETGNFENAVKWQQKAIDLAAEEDIPRWQSVHESRLRLYQSEKTYQGSDPWSLSAGAMIAYWDFEQSDSKVVKDSSGNGLDGRLVGDAHLIEDPDRGGQVLHLDGDQDWVDCGKDRRFDITSEITIACWIKVDSFDETWQTVISKGDRAWRLSRDLESDRLYFACSGVSVPGDIFGSVSGRTNVNDGRWHYVAGVYDGMRSCLYIDGVLDVSSEASGEIGTNAWSVLIGANEETTAQEWPDRSFDGLIDDMRIYDYALTEAEIKTLYGERKSVPNEN